VGPDGATVKPAAENGVKMEMFIFDVFEHSVSFAAMEVVREEEFAPVKNAPGAGKDCPETARDLIFALCRRYVEAAGAVVLGGGVRVGFVAQHVDGPVEVSPLLSYGGEGLEDVCGGKTLETPVLLE
jgi:UDP-N-acetylglucosamine/UDP-N-acetylgalactosamine diphosphorylase